VNEILLVALGDVGDQVLGAIENRLWQVFDHQVRCLPCLSAPAYAYDAKRQQYGAVEILRRTLASAPPETHRLLAVTEADLFIPMLSFVFGQAQLNGTAAVVSLARLRQEFYGLTPHGLLLLERAGKEAVHEIGHTYGLLHCPDPGCPMSLSNTLRQVDHKGEDLCMNCSIMVEELTKQKRTMRGAEGIR